MADLPLTVREAVPSDCEDIAALFNGVIAERLPWFFSRTEHISISQALGLIERLSSAPNSILLVADSNEGLAGILDCHGYSLPSQVHAAQFNLLVAQPYRAKSVGSALVQRLISWVEEQRVIVRLEAEVVSNNEASLALCSRFGLLLEGRKRNAVRVCDQYLDLCSGAPLGAARLAAESSRRALPPYQAILVEVKPPGLARRSLLGRWR